MIPMTLRENCLRTSLWTLLILALCFTTGCNVDTAPLVDDTAAEAVVENSTTTPLDDYVNAEDPAFFYDPAQATVTKMAGLTAYAYLMTSQEWLDASKIDRTAWKHWITIYVPEEIEYTKAMLFVSGGGNGKTEAPKPDETLAKIALLTKTIAINVGQIPNQVLHFPDEHDERYKTRGRAEDEFIAYCWDKYLKTSDPLWLPRLPMTKGVVRAMDLAQKEHPALDGFFVAGGSKRGWTTWTVAAVDKRVIGIAPAVIDVLSVVECLDNHHAAYGFWAPAVGDYKDMNVLSRIHTPEFAALCDVVDPISYVDRLTMPKYIVNSAGDQFFPSDSSKFYFDELQGEKHLRYMANTDHGLNMEAYFNLTSFYHALLADTPRPEFTWKIDDDGAIEVQCTTKPFKVLLWQAINPDARDFRQESVGDLWKSSTLADDGAGVYRTAIEAPEKGWTAFFVELEYPNGTFMLPFKFTTGISILPDTLPHPPTE